MIPREREWPLAFKLAAAFGSLAVAVYLFVRLLPVISMAAVALLIAYSISPLVNYLIQKKVRPFIAATAVAALCLLAIIWFFSLVIPTLLNEVSQLARYLGNELANYLPYLFDELRNLELRFDLSLTDSLMQFSTGIIEQLPWHIQRMIMQVTSYSMLFLSRLWGILGLLFIIFYLVQDMEVVKKEFTRLFPLVYHDSIAYYLAIIDQKVGAYIRGNLLRCLIVGLLTGILLYLLGMPFSLMLGALAGLLNIILYIGPTLAAIPALLISLTPTTPHPLLILVVYISVQLVDAFVLTPLLLGKAVNLRPITIIFVILIGGQLLGLLGIILAIPATAVLKVLIAEYYLKKPAA